MSRSTWFWAQARASNTSPVIVLRFEGDTQDALKRIQEEFRKALQPLKPGVPLRVEDEGGVVWSVGGQAVEAKPPQFVVYCDKPVDEKTQAAIARCIEQFKPVHTAYRLRVRAPKNKPTES